jgi:serine/threonine protein kinase
MFGIGTIFNYEDFEQVGEGTYGVVFKACHKSTKETVALKKLIIHKVSNGFPLCTIREIKLLKCLQHENIVQLKDIITSKGVETHDTINDITLRSQPPPITSASEKLKNRSIEEQYQRCGQLYLVFEYIEHDLGGLIDSKFIFSEILIKSIMKQLFSVLDYLSANGEIVHLKQS